MRGSWPIEIPYIQSTKQQPKLLSYPSFLLSTLYLVVRQASMRFVSILGGLFGPRRSSMCFSPMDPSGSGSGDVSAENELYISPIDP
jgi:hypothetical protein